MEATDSDDESDPEEESESSDDEVDHMFEVENAWRLELVWALGASIAHSSQKLLNHFVVTIKRWSMISMAHC